MIELVLRLIAGYAGIGVLVALAFVTVGVRRLDAAARDGSWGFRLAILPGCVVLWPVVLRLWIRGTEPHGGAS